MPRSIEEIERYIAELPENVQLELIERLYANLSKNEPAIEQAWADEGERRLDELLSGKVKGIPASEVMGRMRAKFGERD